LCWKIGRNIGFVDLKSIFKKPVSSIATRESSAARGLERLPFRGPMPARMRGRLQCLLKKRWKAYRSALKKCQKKFTEKRVHATRVETRRLAALVELLSPLLKTSRCKTVICLLKHHLDTFDELRDTQVQLPAFCRLRTSFPCAEAIYKHLKKRESRLTGSTLKHIKEIKTRRLRKCLARCRDDLQAWKAAEADQRLLTSVDRAFDRAWQLQQRISPADTQSIHCTRIAFKKFRYMVETLACFWPLQAQNVLARMHAYQTAMGVIQDAQVRLQTWDKFVRKRKLDASESAKVRKELIRQRQTEIRSFLRQGKRLVDFWKKRTAPAAEAAHGSSRLY
jgi:CHAD domain-containing protein